MAECNTGSSQMHGSTTRSDSSRSVHLATRGSAPARTVVPTSSDRHSTARPKARLQALSEQRCVLWVQMSYSRSFCEGCAPVLCPARRFEGTSETTKEPGSDKEKQVGAAEAKQLRSGQYKDASRLDAHIALHREFSVNRQGWPAWLFEQLDLPARVDLLELGAVGRRCCGSRMLIGSRPAGTSACRTSRPE
jgi:hypothetical protein